MSINQLDYLPHRIPSTAIIAGSELTHVSLTNYASNPVANDDGSGDPWIDLHLIPFNLEDWDYVWNSNMTNIGNRLYQNSVRISELYKLLGESDPEPGVGAGGGPTGGGGVGNVYVFINPVADGPANQRQVGHVEDGQPYREAIGQLWSIIGSRSFTGTGAFGDWRLFLEQDGKMIRHSEPITSYVDRFDRIFGGDRFTGYRAAPFSVWNAYDVLANATNQSTDVAYSIMLNMDFMNRSIGSRTIPNLDWNLGRNDQLGDVEADGGAPAWWKKQVQLPDARQNLTDFIIDINEILGHRTINYPIGANVFSLAPLFVISNEGGVSDNTTFTSFANQINEGIGHRVIESRTDYFPLRSLSGATITLSLNALNDAIGDRVISLTGNYFPFRNDTNQTMTTWVNTANEAIGSRVYTQGVNYALNGANDTTSTLTSEKLNLRIGDFTAFAHQGINVNNTQTAAQNISSLSAAIGSRVITANATGFLLEGQTGLNITSMMNAINDRAGTRIYTGQALTYLTNSETLVSSLQSLADGLKNLDDFLGHTPNDVNWLPATYDFISLVYTNGSTDGTRNTLGWMPNNISTLKDVLQAIIDRIDDLSGFGV